MLQPELSSNVRSHSGCAIAFAGMVAACNKAHTTFACVVGLRLGDLAGDEYIGTGGDCLFKVALRTPVHQATRCIGPGLAATRVTGRPSNVSI